MPGPRNRTAVIRSKKSRTAAQGDGGDRGSLERAEEAHEFYSGVAEGLLQV